MAATTLSTAIQVNDVIASVVVTAFAQEKNLADLIDLNSSASHVLGKVRISHMAREHLLVTH
ncbi:hypothetical protein NHU86_04880 [Aeromonas caviae]|uniref:hypothetical protein n=1 Tax=Aeromonas caviae TaxID=648 RepID=UPI003081D12B|nr:hypothetical protein NHU86_04880 [Aeromonas caviae]